MYSELCKVFPLPSRVKSCMKSICFWVHSSPTPSSRRLLHSLKHAPPYSGACACTLAKWPWPSMKQIANSECSRSRFNLRSSQNKIKNKSSHHSDSPSTQRGKHRHATTPFSTLEERPNITTSVYYQESISLWTRYTDWRECPRCCMVIEVWMRDRALFDLISDIHHYPDCYSLFTFIFLITRYILSSTLISDFISHSLCYPLSITILIHAPLLSTHYRY